MRNRRWWLGAAAIAGALALAWLAERPSEPVGPAPAGALTGSGARIFGTQAPAPGAPAPAAPASLARQLRERFELADKTLCDYRRATRYPDSSRPLADHQDQLHPNMPVLETHSMRGAGGRSDPAVQIQTSQSRVFMVAGESVRFSLRALGAERQVLPLVVTRAVAQGMTYQGARPTAQVPLAFADNGADADAAAGDGTWAGTLAPAQTSLAAFHGTIRAEIRYTVGGKAGVALFDVIYSPEVPAVWSGPVREVLEDGSLVYYLKAEVRQAGRYVVSGRVIDAAGTPIALATFNDVVAAGPTEFKLTVFGKLLRDRQALTPLTLRDVEGYLLRENTDPDRALMPRREGSVMVGKPYPSASFSDAEWESAERTRYLTEFGKDLAQARKALAALDPALPPPASSCPHGPVK